MPTTTPESQAFRVTIATADVTAFRDAMTRAAYAANDTGERVLTDAGPGAETVLVVTVPRETGRSRSDRVIELLVP